MAMLAAREVAAVWCGARGVGCGDPRTIAVLRVIEACAAARVLGHGGTL